MPPGDRPRTGDADLLADDGAHGGLRAVDLARHAQARGGPHQRAEQRVGAELRVDGGRVAVGVEEAAYALARGRGVAQVVQPELGGDEAGAAARGQVGEVEPDGAGTVREVERAGVAAGLGDLDARDDVEGEEVEEPPAGERRAHGQPHRHRTGRPARSRRPATGRARAAALGEAS